MLVGIDPDPYWLKIRSWLFGRVEAKADITGVDPRKTTFTGVQSGRMGRVEYKWGCNRMCSGAAEAGLAFRHETV